MGLISAGLGVLWAGTPGEKEAVPCTDWERPQKQSAVPTRGARGAPVPVVLGT